MSEISNQIEALLFSSGRAMSVEDIANLINVDKKEVRNALKGLKEHYEAAETSLMVMQEGEFWKLSIKEKHVSLVTKIIADTEMNIAVLETLAVIAWKSPVLQSEVVKLRTSNAYEHIKELVDAGFINKEREGRSYRLKIAEKFFEYFDVPGDKGIKEAFKEVKIPVKKEPEHLGELEVVPIEEDKNVVKSEAPEEPKVEIPPIDEEFLDKVGRQIEQVSSRNDELENDELFKRKPEEQGLSEETNEDSSEETNVTEDESIEEKKESSDDDVKESENSAEELGKLDEELEEDVKENLKEDSENSEDFEDSEDELDKRK
ncbi:MAG: SMC-Scp complex subunit ScpB [archaeon]